MTSIWRADWTDVSWTPTPNAAAPSRIYYNYSYFNDIISWSEPNQSFGFFDSFNLAEISQEWTPYYNVSSGRNRTNIIPGKTSIEGSVQNIRLQAINSTSTKTLYGLILGEDYVSGNLLISRTSTAGNSSSSPYANGRLPIFNASVSHRQTEDGSYSFVRYLLGGKVNKATISMREGDDLKLSLDSIIFQDIAHNISTFPAKHLSVTKTIPSPKSDAGRFTFSNASLILVGVTATPPTTNGGSSGGTGTTGGGTSTTGGGTSTTGGGTSTTGGGTSTTGGTPPSSASYSYGLYYPTSNERLVHVAYALYGSNNTQAITDLKSWNPSLSTAVGTTLLTGTEIIRFRLNSVNALTHLYTVQVGDNAAQIASRVGTTLTEICSRNGTLVSPCAGTTQPAYNSLLSFPVKYDTTSSTSSYLISTSNQLAAPSLVNIKTYNYGVYYPKSTYIDPSTGTKYSGESLKEVADALGTTTTKLKSLNSTLSSMNDNDIFKTQGTKATSHTSLYFEGFSDPIKFPLSVQNATSHTYLSQIYDKVNRVATSVAMLKADFCTKNKSIISSANCSDSSYTIPFNTELTFTVDYWENYADYQPTSTDATVLPYDDNYGVYYPKSTYGQYGGETPQEIANALHTTVAVLKSLNPNHVIASMNANTIFTSLGSVATSATGYAFDGFADPIKFPLDYKGQYSFIYVSQIYDKFERVATSVSMGFSDLCYLNPTVSCSTTNVLTTGTYISFLISYWPTTSGTTPGDGGGDSGGGGGGGVTPDPISPTTSTEYYMGRVTNFSLTINNNLQPYYQAGSSTQIFDELIEGKQTIVLDVEMDVVNQYDLNMFNFLLSQNKRSTNGGYGYGFGVDLLFTGSEGLTNARGTYNKRGDSIPYSMRISCGISPNYEGDLSIGRPGAVVENGSIFVNQNASGYLSARFRLNVDTVEIYNY